MAKGKVRKTGKGAPKKKWIEILAPKVFNQQSVGETYVFDIREAIGKPVTINLMALTKSHRKQGTNVMFKITGQHEGKLTTDFMGIRIMPPVVRRMVRRGKEKIEDSFICSTSDGKKVRIKPIVVTRSKSKGSVTSALRKAAKMFLARTIAKTSYDTLVELIVDSKLQKGMYETLSKIYPVSVCEIRWFSLIEDKTFSEEKKADELVKEEENKETVEVKEEKTETVEPKEAEKTETVEVKKEKTEEAPVEVKEEATVEA